MATSFYLVFFSAGGLIAPIVSAAIMGPVGWRGVASLGFLALIIGVLVWRYAPESVRWLAAKGRLVEAQAEVAQYLGLPLSKVSLPTHETLAQPRGNLLDLLSQPRMFVETVLIWGGSSNCDVRRIPLGSHDRRPVVKVTVPRAAAFFIFVSAAGVLGKIAVTLLAPALGRRYLGIIWGFGGAAALAAAGYENTEFVAGLPLMIVLLCVANFCVEGGFANLAPYTVERYGVSLGARASGLGQAANGFGKIIGPLSLSFIAGTNNLVTSQQTASAVLPTFLFLAGCMVPVALWFLLLGVETHGKAIEIDVQNKH